MKTQPATITFNYHELKTICDVFQNGMGNLYHNNNNNYEKSAQMAEKEIHRKLSNWLYIDPVNTTQATRTGKYDK